MQGTGQITLDQASPFADGEEDTTMQDDGNILMQEDHPIVHEEAGRGDDCNMQNDGETLIQQESSVAKGSAQAREKVFAIEADGEIERLQQSAVGNAGETEHSEDTSSQELAIGDFTEPSSHEVKEVTALSLHIFSAPLPCIECGVEDGHDYSCGIGGSIPSLIDAVKLLTDTSSYDTSLIDKVQSSPSARNPASSRRRRAIDARAVAFQ
jgi:hypothetical protein